MRCSTRNDLDGEEFELGIMFDIILSGVYKGLRHLRFQLGPSSFASGIITTIPASMALAKDGIKLGSHNCLSRSKEDCVFDVSFI